MSENKKSAKGNLALGQKIAVINSIYQPYTRGGAEVVAGNIVSGLKNQGHDVFVISLGYENKLNYIDEVKSCQIKPFNFFNFLDINFQPVWLRFLWHPLDMFNGVQTWRVYRILHKEKPDLILTHNLKGLGYLLPWLIRMMKIKHIHSIHDMQLIHPSGLLKEDEKINFLVAIYSWLNKRLFNKVEYVIFPSKYIKSIYDRYNFFSQANKLVLGNPVIIHPLPRGGRGGVAESIGQPPLATLCKEGDFQIIFLGQVEEYKGIFDLIEAVKKIKSNFTLHIVGDGSALARAKDETKDDARFKFHGRLSHSELKEKIWPNIDLLINPTKVAESFGLVIVEAWVYRVPSLASNIGAIPELIDDGQTGWLFESGDIDDLSSKIKIISDNICGFQAIGLLGREKAKEFNIDNYLNRLEEFAKIKPI
ncbi:MAG: glycosyltransferase [Candidatus Buchananbacteria bacterium]|nr:glycosyltransferase [Candidatus Buchananbacteria bacterium]